MRRNLTRHPDNAAGNLVGFAFTNIVGLRGGEPSLDETTESAIAYRLLQVCERVRVCRLRARGLSRSSRVRLLLFVFRFDAVLMFHACRSLSQ